MNISKLPIASIALDDEVQARIQPDWITVSEYASAMRDGAVFPPVTVFFDGETYWLADGFHRINAARDHTDLTEFAADVHEGGKREAQWYALGANQNFGVRRNNGDLKKIARRIYEDPEWLGIGQREIARHTGIPETTLRRWFAEFESSAPSAQMTRPSVKEVSRNGRTYEMNTAAIGRRAEEPEDEPEPQDAFDWTEEKEEAAVSSLSPTALDEMMVARGADTTGQPGQPAPGKFTEEHKYETVGPEPATLEGHSLPSSHPAAAHDSTPQRINIINGDAQRVAELVAEPVHLIVTSPPYNVGIDYDASSDDLLTYLPMLQNVWRGCHKVMVDGARICVVVPFGVGRNPYVPFDCQIMETLTNVGFTIRGRIIWDKNTTGNRTSWGSWRMASAPALRDTTECIIVAHKGSGTLPIPPEHIHQDAKGNHTAWLADADYFMELAQDHWVVAPESAQRVKHPAPFPAELVTRLLHFYAYPGAHVLDPFGGSGSTGVAAKRLGCSATLIDMSQKYCALAQERIDND